MKKIQVGINESFVKTLADLLADSVKKKVNEVASSENLLTIIDMAKNNPGKIGDFISSLVNVEKVREYPIENYGSAMAPFMPFTYSVNAMRETIGGLYGYDYIFDLLRLLAFIPFALLLGLVLRNPLYRLNEFFEKKMEETKFMH